MLFKFKEFSVKQNKTAMKIGTDAVLLGAWTEIPNTVNSILDIGTGTGILTLQMAQRSCAEVIDAVELEPNAYEEAVGNFENSPWSDRLFCYHASIFEFTTEIDETYDLILSNPPFYTDKFNSKNKNRHTARSTDSLNFEELLQSVSTLLHKDGTFSVIIPFKEENSFIKLAKSKKLFPYRITRVRGNLNSKIKRSLLQFSFIKINTITQNELVIEIERHIYTKEYVALVQDFYLKM